MEVSMTETVPVLPPLLAPLATYAMVSAGFTATPNGPPPTIIVAILERIGASGFARFVLACAANLQIDFHSALPDSLTADQ
jgi:hypothetical protein